MLEKRKSLRSKMVLPSKWIDKNTHVSHTIDSRLQGKGSVQGRLGKELPVGAKIQAAVHRLENERCPWVALLEKSHQQ
jgi:hypothetical protein